MLWPNRTPCLWQAHQADCFSPAGRSSSSFSLFTSNKAAAPKCNLPNRVHALGALGAVALAAAPSDRGQDSVRRREENFILFYFSAQRRAARTLIDLGGPLIHVGELRNPKLATGTSLALAVRCHYCRQSLEVAVCGGELGTWAQYWAADQLGAGLCCLCSCALFASRPGWPSGSRVRAGHLSWRPSVRAWSWLADLLGPTASNPIRRNLARRETGLCCGASIRLASSEQRALSNGWSWFHCCRFCIIAAIIAPAGLPPVCSRAACSLSKRLHQSRLAPHASLASEQVRRRARRKFAGELLKPKFAFTDSPRTCIGQLNNHLPINHARTHQMGPMRHRSKAPQQSTNTAPNALHTLTATH